MKYYQNKIWQCAWSLRVWREVIVSSQFDIEGDKERQKIHSHGIHVHHTFAIHSSELPMMKHEKIYLAVVTTSIIIICQSLI